MKTALQTFARLFAAGIAGAGGAILIMLWINQQTSNLRIQIAMVGALAILAWLHARGDE